MINARWIVLSFGYGGEDENLKKTKPSPAKLNYKNGEITRFMGKIAENGRAKGKGHLKINSLKMPKNWLVYCNAQPRTRNRFSKWSPPINAELIAVLR